MELWLALMGGIASSRAAPGARGGGHHESEALLLGQWRFAGKRAICGDCAAKELRAGLWMAGAFAQGPSILAGAGLAAVESKHVSGYG